MSSAHLLVELGTEELPPKSLFILQKAFETELCAALSELRLNFVSSESFATPRRLAVRISGLDLIQADEQIETLGPNLAAAYDANGQPTPAALGFARKCGLTSLDGLETVSTDKGDRLALKTSKPGVQTEDLLGNAIAAALGRLPIAKRMRWGSSRHEFARPPQWLLVLLGDKALPLEVLGLTGGTTTRGHRFHADRTALVKHPASYEQVLFDLHVVVDPDKRREIILEQVEQLAMEEGGRAVVDPALLDEVNAMVEWPVALCGSFDADFLRVPQEALVSSMGEHQKYFHLVDAQGKLLPRFITVSNLDSKHPEYIVSGNERVIRPRLSDARFFYETDLKQPLASQFGRLENILFQAELGTIADKSRRVSDLAKALAPACAADADQAARAAMLAKCDLVSEMVLEFDQLQGIMGRYYALAGGESAEASEAILEQYLPRSAGGDLPKTPTGACLALADRLDTLVGIFGIGQPPTGSRDPFALRRASIGVLNILVEREITIDLAAVLGQAYDLHNTLGVDRAALITQVRDYMIERFRALFEDRGVPVATFRAVRKVQGNDPLDIHRRVIALQHFILDSDARALAEANKRVQNILASNDSMAAGNVDRSLFNEQAETALLDQTEAVGRTLQGQIEAHDYQAALATLGSLRQPLDAFFESVMVMADDPALRANRLALLRLVRSQVMRVADLSELGGQL